MKFKIFIATTLYCVTLNAYEIPKDKVDDWLKDTNLTCQLFHTIDTTNLKNWRAYLVTKDDKKLVFNSVKTMFNYFYANFQKHDENMSSMLVTDYKNGNLVDATNAFYIFGSNIMSARGDDLIPFENLDDAKEFYAKNSGHKILKFQEINKNLIDYLR